LTGKYGGYEEVSIVMSSIKYWVWFSSLVAVSPLKKIQLLEFFNDPALLWECTEHDLKQLDFCTPGIIKAITDKATRKELPRMMKNIAENDIDVMTIKDSSYPEELKNIPDPPVVLYYRGKLVKEEIRIAVVGSRRATFYGLDMAKRLSAELAQKGVTVVSGMARGIDSEAHKGALEAGGRTIAVFGCGVDITYPPENVRLKEQIVKSGAVISEYLPGTPPVPINFPARNRIISGLSRGVVVVEAGEKSGSLITADFALEQGRDVFAIPGNIDSKNSRGTNRLIKDGAKIVTNADDIMEELRIEYKNQNIIENKDNLKTRLLDANERTIAQRLAKGVAHIDVIARDCGIDVQLAASILFMLELGGFVEQLPGKYYKLAE